MSLHYIVFYCVCVSSLQLLDITGKIPVFIPDTCTWVAILTILPVVAYSAYVSIMGPSNGGPFIRNIIAKNLTEKKFLAEFLSTQIHDER